MKRKLTLLIAALALLTMGVLPGKAVGQTTVTQTSFSGVLSQHVQNDDKVTFNCFKGGGSGTPYADNNGVIRLYQILNSAYVGSYIIIGVADGYRITSATIQSTMATTTGYKLTETNPNTSSSATNTTIINDFNVNNYALSANTDYTVNNISTQYITFGCFGTSSSARLYLSKLSITYEETSTGPTKLSTPANFAAEAGDGQATFTWNAVDNANSYTISYTPDGGDEAFETGITGTSKTITGLTNDTEYTCMIKAVGDGENYSDSDYSSSITVTPTDATFYNINITSPLTGGSVSASAATATAGTTITLTASPEAGYTFNNIVSNWSSNPSVTITPSEGNTATFEMPASDVTVGATFTAMPVYTVSCTTPENGTLSVSPTSGYNGVQVTITATPNSGYELATLTATDDEDEITITDNKFNIRNSNVTVAATFTPVIVYEWVPVAIGDLTGSDIFVIVGSHSGTYAMTNNNGTGSAPTATSVTISGGKITSTVTDNMIWNISGNSTDGYTFYPNGTTSTWLYCNTTANSSSNNNMRVGTGNRKVFKQDASNHLLTKDTYTDRYVSVYSGSDWRGYVSSSTEPTTVAFYKRVIPAAVETPVISLATGTYNTNQSVTITCATDGATIYYTIDGTTPTSSSTEYTEAISITQTTTLKAIAIKGDDESNVASATYTLKCATPTFSPIAGAYTSVQNVTISSTSPEVSIYYTLDGTTPTSSSTLYNGAINVGETKTIKAIAIKNNWTDSEIATAAYTIELPLTTMDEIYAKALEYGTNGGNVNITFGNWVITGVNGSNAYLTDGTKGCIIYKNGHGFNVGNILSGTAACGVKIYNNAPELYNLTSTTTGLVVNTGGTITPTTTTIAALSAVNTGSVFTLRDLTYTYLTDMLSDGTNEIKLKNNLYDFSSIVEDGGKYHVTGVFVLYGEQKQIYPRSEEDIVLAADMSATDFSGLTAFTYVVNNGPSAAQYIGVDGTNFASDLTITASSDYEICTTANGTYTSSIEVEQEEGEIAETLYVRLKAGLATGEHNGTLTFEADNLTTKVVNLEGMVSATQTYSIMINSPIANGNVTADASVAEAGATITLTATPDECYQFVEWVTEPDDLTWTSDNQFTMPAEDVLISATFSQITYTVQYSINGNVEDDLEEDVNCGDEASLWDNDEVAILGVTLPSGFSLLGWSTTEGGTETVASFEPEADATLYAVLIPTGFVMGYELVTSVSQITEGKYLFAALRATELPNPVVYSIANGIISSGAIQVTSEKFAPTNNVFETIPTGGVEFELTGNNTDGFVISYNSKTLGYTAAQNNKLAFGDYDYLWKFYAKEGGLSTGAVYMHNYRNYTNYTVSENSTGTEPIRGYANTTVYRGFYLFKKAETTPISIVTEITEPDASMSTNIPESTCVIVKDGAVLTFSGENQGTAANLIIEDGGQLIHTNAVNATLQKNITAASSWKDDVDGWFFIASPVDGAVITESFTISPLNAIDLFRYDEPSAYWMAYWDTPGFANMERGSGYLHASQNAQTVNFAGEMINTESEFIKPLSYKCGYADLIGFNLVGNPFTRNLVEGEMKIGGSDLTLYYGINDETTGMKVKEIDENPIKPGQGFFVQATSTDQDLIITPSKKGETVDKGCIRIAAGNDDYMDKAYIQIKNGNTLRKMNITNSTKVYVMNGDDDYAATRVEELAGAMPVNFKAIEDGTYTITVETKNIDAYYLHLIDNFTNEDIDLLLEPTYTFTANADDAEGRFRLVFDFNDYTGIEENNTNSNFVYQFGNEILVNGEGTLQVFDVMGRLVTSFTVNGNERLSTSQLNTGVYIFRMVGSEVKTQKVVVR